jgi:hypothetical protein
MAGKTEFPLALVIKAVDKATAPLRKINDRIKHATAPVRRLGNSLKAFGEEAGFPKLLKGFQGVGSALSNVGSAAFAVGQRIVAMAGVAGFALFSIVKGAVDAGDKLAEMADRVGLGVDVYASLQHAAAQADVEQEQFNSAMDQFNRRLGEAKANGGPLLAFLKRVSPAFAQQVKSAKTTEAALGLVTDAMAKIEDPGKRAALAAAAFGKSGLQMGNFLAQGSAEIQRQQLAYLRLAGSQEAFARGAGALDNVLREAEVAFAGVRNALAAELFPVFKELAEMLRDFLADNRGELAKWARETAGAIRDWVKGGGIQRITAAFKRFIAVVDPIVQKLGGWPVVIAAIAAAITAGPLLMALGGLAASFVTLGLAIGATPVGWFLLAVAAIATAAWLVIDNWSHVTGFFEDITASWKQSFSGFSEFIRGVFTGDLSRAWEGLKDVFSGGGKFWATLLDGWVAMMKLSLAPILKPIEWAMKAAGVTLPKAASFRSLLGVDSADPSITAPSLGAAEARPMLGAESAAPLRAAQSKTEAHVTVDFNNLPRGARVTPARDNSTPLDLSVGYSMVTP